MKLRREHGQWLLTLNGHEQSYVNFRAAFVAAHEEFHWAGQKIKNHYAFWIPDAPSLDSYDF